MITVRELAPGPSGGASSTGQSVPVLLVGPSLGSRVDHLWSACLPALGARVRVLGWDLPGHGGAAPAAAGWSVDDLAAALADEVARIDAPTVVAGVSLGGAASLTLAASSRGTGEAGTQSPAHLIGVAGLCTSPRFGTPEAWLDRAELVRTQDTQALLEGSRERWFSPASRNALPAVVDEALADLEAVDDASYAACCEALARYDLTARLGDISVPTLALGGVDDAVCPPEVIEQIARGVGPHAEAVVLPEVAHLAPAEAPAATSEHLLALVDRALDAAHPIESLD